MKNKLIVTALLSFFATTELAHARTLTASGEESGFSSEFSEFDAVVYNKQKCEDARRDLTTAGEELADAEGALAEATTDGAKRSAQKRIDRANKQIADANKRITKYC